MRADQRRRCALREVETRLPHQRAVAEYPKLAMEPSVVVAVGPAEIGGLGVLARLDDPAADGAGAGEQRFERRAVVPADHALERGKSSEKRPSISSTASLLFRNTSRHMTGSEAAMRVKSRKPPAENLITSPIGDLLQVGGGADDVVGDEVRHVAGDGEHDVVMLGVHRLDLGAAGARTRRAWPPPAASVPGAASGCTSGLEQLGEAGVGTGMLGAGDRVAGTK